MEGVQSAARAGCSGTVDILLIDQTVTTYCHRGRRNVSMAWIVVEKACDSVDHGWLQRKARYRFHPTKIFDDFFTLF